MLYPGARPRGARSRRPRSPSTSPTARCASDRLLAAIERGERSRAALLAEVWDDVPEELRGAAAIAMQAHLEKLQDEGRLPADLRD